MLIHACHFRTKLPHSKDFADLELCGACDQKPISEINNAIINGPILPDGEIDASSEAATFGSGSLQSVESVPSVGGGRVDATSRLSDPEWLFDAAPGSVGHDAPKASRCTTERASREVSVRLSPTTLENMSKPLLDRSEFGEVNATKVRAEDVKVAAAEQKFGRTTESQEFIQHDPEFIIPGPNPTRVPHDELFNAFQGFSNMFLAHEISLSPDFRVERYTPPPES